ncbi:linear amide C-N hydrolase [Nonomuraea indica]|uniref:linear amide C-N hydrolase n=1 Tax=Nonomuraea indica TaxID=1581193 RepID=UPI000C7A0B89|nr:linear amide C-N hydrolase [Nonomuraea indica]
MRSPTAALLAALILTVPSAVACAPGSGSPTGGPPPTPAPRQAERSASLLRQTPAERARTIASLRQVDDLPLYEMTYHGGYDIEAPLTDEELGRGEDGWACSLFHRGAEFGRNFDWDPNPAMVVRADPPDGHASLSVVDVSYLLGGTGPADLKDAADRRRLGHAVLSPFDGMNDQGLAVGLAQTPDAELPARTPGRARVSSVRIMRLVLDRAATVEEALTLMRRYDVDFTGGPQVHYLLADRSGRSAVVEYGQGRMHVIDDRVLTNITMAGTDRRARLADTRYRTLTEGIGTRADALGLLRRVAQPHTRWSVVYDLKAGTARIVTGQRWSRVHTFAIAAAASPVSSPG